MTQIHFSAHMQQMTSRITDIEMHNSHSPNFECINFAQWEKNRMCKKKSTEKDDDDDVMMEKERKKNIQKWNDEKKRSIDRYREL